MPPTSVEINKPPHSSRKRALRWRLFMRLIGTMLATLPLVVALHTEHAAPGWIIALVTQAVLWPPLAFALAWNSGNPKKAELHNLLIDSISAGFWLGVVGFNLLPSIMLASLLTMDRTQVGGLSLGMKSLAAMVLTAIIISAALGLRFNPITSSGVMLACLPMLVVHPFLTGLSAHRITEKMVEQRRQLERNLHFDFATGLMNRQQLLFAATEAMERFHRTRRPSVLVMIDIDRFKQINDQFGHTVGDAVVEQFARLIRPLLRDVDICGRYGGDEFGIVMPDMQWPEGIEAAERLRRQVAACQLFPNNLQCTISAGLAETHSLIRTTTDWVHLADSALYTAKRRGRDCISIARPPSFITPPEPAPAAT
jgi:diguanylate cyclase